MTERSSAPLPLDKTPRRIEGMFDAIAGRYDFLNRLLSAGLDRTWRTRAVVSLAVHNDACVLDLCTGTADLALTLASRHRSATTIGVDFAAEMLRHGQEKVRRGGHTDRVSLVRGDAVHIPVSSAAVDGAMIAFGIRNVEEPERALLDIHRVLKVGGRLAILEFGYPRAPLFKAAYLWYFRTVLPLIGRLVSKHDSAYRYLPASVGTFYEPEAFCRLVAASGFSDIRAIPLTFGIVYLYTAVKDAVSTRKPSGIIE
jgi:demethylmenaquinone methyltransferase/2-methoxy-6-polyprenyl-1,4-benzoquinol methylase